MTPVITIQLFTADHTSMPFTCGVRRIDDYFAHGALIQKERLARLFIALDRATRRTALGFYALHNTDIEADVVLPWELWRFPRWYPAAAVASDRGCFAAGSSQLSKDLPRWLR